MDAEYAEYYTREVMLILIREFQSPDEEMKKIVLKVNLLLLLMCGISCCCSFALCQSCCREQKRNSSDLTFLTLLMLGGRHSRFVKGARFYWKSRLEDFHLVPVVFLI